MTIMRNSYKRKMKKKLEKISSRANMAVSNKLSPSQTILGSKLLSSTTKSIKILTKICRKEISIDFRSILDLKFKVQLSPYLKKHNLCTSFLSALAWSKTKATSVYLMCQTIASETSMSWPCQPG